MGLSRHFFYPKDFIETEEGLCFAVVQFGLERYDGKEKVLCFLRYIKREGETHLCWHKVTTDTANAFLERHFPGYLYHSSVLDAHLHAVDTSRILHHHQPKQRLQQILLKPGRDQVEQDLCDLCGLLEASGLDLRQTGVTGSLLIGAQNYTSDIDLVIYDRDLFHRARKTVGELIDQKKLNALDAQGWEASYARRSSSLSLEDYVKHEQRKFNKALINGRKFDLNLVLEETANDPASYKKCGGVIVHCKITDDWCSFDYPSIYSIDHEEISTVVCFTATYTGQAKTGETVEIAGLLEQADDGGKRIVVGSTREAHGEYIKVIG